MVLRALFQEVWGLPFHSESSPNNEVEVVAEQMWRDWPGRHKICGDLSCRSRYLVVQEPWVDPPAS